MPELQRLDLDPFRITVADLPWRTTRVLLGAELTEVTLELLAPYAGALQILSLGVD